MQTAQPATPPSQTVQAIAQPASDEAYLKILEVMHEFTRTRWTVVTFFMGISFALFGFSFQDELKPFAAMLLRLAGALIYWFAFALFVHLYRYSKWLQSYLRRLETAGQTTLNLMGWHETLFAQSMSGSITHSLLAIFGLIYTFGSILLWLLGI